MSTTSNFFFTKFFIFSLLVDLNSSLVDKLSFYHEVYDLNSSLVD